MKREKKGELRSMEKRKKKNRRNECKRVRA